MFVCINGKFLLRNKAKVSALDHGFLYGDGIYETLRTYQGVIFELDVHLKRLRKSAKGIGLRLAWPVTKIKQWANKLVKLNNARVARVRITLTRGVNNFDFSTCKNPTLVIHSENLRVRPEVYTKGVPVVTMRLQRILPEIKTIGLTHMIQAYRAFDPKKITEAIIIDKKNFVKEGASTNVFVVKGGVIWTPKSGILVGTTRNRVIDLAQKNGFKVAIKDFKADKLATADEIFLTNRPREIMPVTRLNGKKVGNGRVGAVTQKIMHAYQEYVKNYVKAHRS